MIGLISLIMFALLPHIQSWVPPGMSERSEHDHSEQEKDLPPGHGEHHDHSDNIDVADLVVDTEHMVDDLGDWYTKAELETMNVDEKVFTWFTAHDWDANDHLDGLELIKALSHEHNYHHPEEEHIPEEDELHDPAQHTDAAERQRFRRTEKIVDKILDEDDSNNDGLFSFPEFMSAFHSAKLDGLKLRKVQ
eukprot:GFUD01009936.1.p1 GENE.GFUD01009936.1~~GFUD01009936.1.p1  ORF type:complete len:192 (+),score=52.27 GFUD01009936.1:352-927(+)